MSRRFDDMIPRKEILTRYRLHQHEFRFEVLAAYRQRCTICALKERSLLQAAHIIEDIHACSATGSA